MKRIAFTLFFILFVQIYGFGQGAPVPSLPEAKPIIDPDRFPNNSPWKDEKFRLSLFANELKQKETALLYIVIQTKNPKSKKLSQRQKRIMSFLTNDSKIKKKRVTIVVVASEFEETIYWIVPPGANVPYPIQNRKSKI